MFCLEQKRLPSCNEGFSSFSSKTSLLCAPLFYHIGSLDKFTLFFFFPSTQSLKWLRMAMHLLYNQEWGSDLLIFLPLPLLVLWLQITHKFIWCQGLKHRALCMLVKHSPNYIPSPALLFRNRKGTMRQSIHLKSIRILNDAKSIHFISSYWISSFYRSQNKMQRKLYL